MVRAKSPLLVDQALKEVKTIIMRNHGGDDTFFRTWSAKKGIANAKRMILIIETVLVVIASVALIVAGIGILNIMLVSVTERIPEIGLRKAVGAKSFDIRLQFLTESVLLCLVGSLLGIAFGTVVGKGFAWIVGKFYTRNGMALCSNPGSRTHFRWCRCRDRYLLRLLSRQPSRQNDTH